MADKLIKLSQLNLVKSYVDTVDATKFQSATYDSSTRTVKFFKGADTTVNPPAFTFTLPEDVDISGKTDKVTSAVSGNFAGLDSNGNLTDSGSKASDFAPANILSGLNSTSSGEGTFVKSVTETSGVVTVTMGTIAASEVPNLTLSKITDAGTAAASDVATTAIAEDTTDDSLVTAAQVASFVQAEVADLSGVLHFRGAVNALSDITDPEAGDIAVIISTGKEYIYVDTKNTWKELGDETAFVLKTTTIAGLDLQDNISVSELNTALGIADMIDDAKYITSVDTSDFAVSAEGELSVASGKTLVTDAQATKLNSIAVDTTAKSVTDGTNTLQNIMVTSDASVSTTSDSDQNQIRTVTVNGTSVSGILTRSDYATDSEVQAIFS